jgi:hypothetical protein
MCWSLSVSAAFALFDLIALLALINRNRQNDRLYAILFSPVAFQEFCQIILWHEIGQSDPDSCSQLNKSISLIMRIVVAFIPAFTSIVPLYHTPQLRNTLAKRKRWAKVGCFYSCLLIFLYIVSFIYRPIGVIAGPNGHQVLTFFLLFSYGHSTCDPLKCHFPLFATLDTKGPICFSRLYRLRSSSDRSGRLLGLLFWLGQVCL